MNKTRWPCEGLSYERTIRARLWRASYRTPLLVLLGVSLFSIQPSWGSLALAGLVIAALSQFKPKHHLDYCVARQTFDPWRARWKAAEEASDAFAAGGDGSNLTERFLALPLGPTLLRPRDHLLKQQIIDLERSPLHPGPASTPDPIAVLARCAYALLQLDPNAVIVRLNDQGIGFYCMLAPTAHYSAWISILPGEAALDVADGVQFWIPEGARARDSQEYGYRGELANFKPPASAFWANFRSTWSTHYDKRPPLPRPELDDVNLIHRYGLFPKAGDSVDLCALYARRPRELSPNEIETEAGEPLFAGVDPRAALMRTRVYERVMRAVKTTRDFSPTAPEA